jgi:truncated hemoglobin YjbI
MGRFGMPIFSRLLRAIHLHRRWGWLALLAYAAAVTFPHENVQWLMNQIAIRISHHRLYQWSAAIAPNRGPADDPDRGLAA